MIENRMARRGQGGFTLIELLVVIAILAILAGAAIVGIGAMRENAKRNACKSDMDTIQTAAEAWDLDETQNTTNTPGFLATGTNKSALDGSGYLKKVPSSDFTLSWSAEDGYAASPVTGSGKYQGVTGC